VSVVVKALSSAGKSYTVKQSLAFFPQTAYYELTAMSEKALIYDDTPLVHRMLVVYEADGIAGELASALLRTLLSEGEIKYTTVEAGSEGIKPRTIHRPGPTGLITTTTALKLHPENETRLLSVTVPDTKEQTSAVMASWAFAAAGGDPVILDYAPWHAHQEWLETGPHEVAIPYAPQLAALVPPAAVRLRRDFISVLTLISAHALLHRASREVDPAGRIRATLEDYAVVRELVDPLISAGVENSVSPEVRETVEAVEAVAIDGNLLGAPRPASQGEIAARMKLDKTTVSRRVKKAIDQGYLRDERQRGREAELVTGEPLPTDKPILPTVHELGG
jgi:MarR family